MSSRPVTALASALFALALPPAMVGVSSAVTDHSGCDPHGFACLGPFFLTALAGLPVGWLLWGFLLQRLGQRLPWLVPPAAVLTVVACERLLSPLVGALPGSGRFGNAWPLLVLAAAAWSWLLGPREAAGPA